MSGGRDGIVEDLCERIARIAYLERAEVSEQSRYVDDLMLDSSGAVQLLVELEELYGVRFSDDEARLLETVDQTADLILSKLAGAEGGAG